MQWPHNWYAQAHKERCNSSKYYKQQQQPQVKYNERQKSRRHTLYIRAMTSMTRLLVLAHTLTFMIWYYYLTIVVFFFRIQYYSFIFFFFEFFLFSFSVSLFSEQFLQFNASRCLCVPHNYFYCNAMYAYACAVHSFSSIFIFIRKTAIWFGVILSM